MKKIENDHQTTQPGSKPNLYLFLFSLIFFGLGIFLQAKYEVYQKVSRCLVSGEQMQRQKLTKLLLPDQVTAWSEVRVKQDNLRGTYREQLLEFIGQNKNDRLLAYLLIPETSSDSSGKFPAALCIHGHHSTKEEVAGLTPSRYQVNFGHTLVQQNYLTLIPDIRYSQDMREEDFMAMSLLVHGKSLGGERVKDLVRCLTFLQNHEQVDQQRVGVVGWSMGGGLALYLSAIDERVKLTYVSCYFGTYDQTILAVRQSSDNYIPGLKAFGELYDVAALIAPRPLFIEHGTPDREFPLESAKMAFEHVKHAYAQFGATEKAQFVIREGGHRFYGDQLLPWYNQFFQR